MKTRLVYVETIEDHLDYFINNHGFSICRKNEFSTTLVNIKSKLYNFMSFPTGIYYIAEIYDIKGNRPAFQILCDGHIKKSVNVNKTHLKFEQLYNEKSILKNEGFKHKINLLFAMSAT